jgi:hypothetical protein
MFLLLNENKYIFFISITFRFLLLIHLHEHLSLGVSHIDLPTVLKALDLAVIQRHRRLSQQRMFAFTKRVTTLALQLLHNGSISCLGIIRTIMQVCIMIPGPKEYSHFFIICKLTRPHTFSFNFISSSSVLELLFFYGWCKTEPFPSF